MSIRPRHYKRTIEHVCSLVQKAEELSFQLESTELAISSHLNNIFSGRKIRGRFIPADEQPTGEEHKTLFVHGVSWSIYANKICIFGEVHGDGISLTKNYYLDPESLVVFVDDDVKSNA